MAQRCTQVRVTNIFAQHCQLLHTWLAMRAPPACTLQHLAGSGCRLTSAGTGLHAGFFYSYNFSNLQPNVSTAVGAMLEQHPGADVYIMGHSMGAAVATICAIDVKFTFNLTRERVHLYTFGSPRVGNDVFASFVSAQIRVCSAFSLLSQLLLRG